MPNRRVNKNKRNARKVIEQCKRNTKVLDELKVMMDNLNIPYLKDSVKICYSNIAAVQNDVKLLKKRQKVKKWFQFWK